MVQSAIRNALQVAPEMFTGSSAEINLLLKKLMASAGFPTDPRIAATEEFKSFIAPILASARLVGGANISYGDVEIVLAVEAGNITLDKETIPKVLAAIERMIVATAINHQKKLDGFSARDPQRQAALYSLYGLPMENIVPRDAVKLLKSQPTPEMMDTFNKKYKTPNLAQKVLGGG